jgi:hypothetical protein
VFSVTLQGELKLNLKQREKLPLLGIFSVYYPGNK